jgi:putative thioredoxin
MPARNNNAAEQLVPLIKAMEDFRGNKLPLESDLDTAFSNSLRLASRGNILASIDGLLDVLRQDKRYRKDRAKHVILGLLELLDPEGEQTRKYRSELATILF